ncbi:MAG: membrane protein insertion efficiency factor YidD [Candidatus Eisenbacteria sp.]|nr:membrane protein insertion efficiency factor YidD [Candidatus Eisenbacteria bacterium]
MRTYKSAISPAGGRRCGMYPSCSSYAQDAVQKLGAVVGVTMACDRLLRCGNDPHFYHLVRDNGRVLRSDPLDDACRSSE